MKGAVTTIFGQFFSLFGVTQIIKSLKKYKNIYLRNQQYGIQNLLTIQKSAFFSTKNHHNCVKVNLFSYFLSRHAATAFVHAAKPHKNASLRLCRKRKTEKMHLDTTPRYTSPRVT
jgi:hypothetical protein